MSPSVLSTPRYPDNHSIPAPDFVGTQLRRYKHFRERLRKQATHGCGPLQVKREVRRGVREIIRKVGLTSILVTHDRDEAFDIADKIVIFNR